MPTVSQGKILQRFLDSIGKVLEVQEEFVMYPEYDTGNFSTAYDVYQRNVSPRIDAMIRRTDSVTLLVEVAPELNARIIGQLLMARLLWNRHFHDGSVVKIIAVVEVARIEWQELAAEHDITVVIV